MDAEFSVELGGDAPALELPWAAPDGRERYFDLRRRPELLLEIPEAARNRALAEFLAAINTPAGALLTAKCDTWFSEQITEEEKIYGASVKFGSYIDLVLHDEARRGSAGVHENFANALCALLAKAPSISAAAEFVLRRCYVHAAALAAGKLPPPDASAGDSIEGYCLTFYLTGYGDDEDEARKRWTIGLKLVENAILQLAAKGIGSAQ